MSPEAFNELIQWLSIFGIILLVLAVYRRLGMIYYDARGLRLAQFGGAVGAVDKKIRPAVFNGLTSSAGPMLLVFTTNGCSVCSHIVEHLSGWAAILSGQLHLVIAAQGPLAYRQEIESTMSRMPALLRVGLSAAVAFLAVGFQAAGTMGVFPQREAQVPRRWLLYGEARAAGAFGFVLGLGVLTRLKYASAYAVLAAVVVLGMPGVAIAGGAMFGLTRGVIPLVAGRLGSIDTHVRLERWLLSPGLNLTLRAVMTTTSLAMFAIVFLHGTSA